MNPWQMAQQIAKELREIAWVGGNAEVVFGTQAGQVAVLAGGPPSEDDFPRAFPAAQVVMGDGNADKDHPQLIKQGFDVVVGVQSYGDHLGELALIGGPIEDVGQSANRGVGEVGERVRKALQELTGADGLRIQLSGIAVDTPFHTGDLRHVVFEGQQFEAWCTSQEAFTAPQKLNQSGNVFTWKGARCHDRYDFKQYRLFTSIGLPVDINDSVLGSPIYTGTAATFTQVAASGQHYTVFADYNDRDTTGVVRHTSAVEIGCWFIK